jgi:hypothetical protein
MTKSGVPGESVTTKVWKGERGLCETMKKTVKYLS